jgi:hypothetical protein
MRCRDRRLVAAAPRHTHGVIGMFNRLLSLLRRQFVADVPAEMDYCLDCGHTECSEGRYQDCALRKARAAEVAAALALEAKARPA